MQKRLYSALAVFGSLILLLAGCGVPEDPTKVDPPNPPVKKVTFELTIVVPQDGPKAVVKGIRSNTASPVAFDDTEIAPGENKVTSKLDADYIQVKSADPTVITLADVSEPKKIDYDPNGKATVQVDELKVTAINLTGYKCNTYVAQNNVQTGDSAVIGYSAENGKILLAITDTREKNILQVYASGEQLISKSAPEMESFRLEKVSDTEVHIFLVDRQKNEDYLRYECTAP